VLIITYLLVVMYCTVKVSTFVGSVQSGTGFGAALMVAWTEAGQALLSGILNFWFISRVLERRNGRA